MNKIPTQQKKRTPKVAAKRKARIKPAIPGLNVKLLRKVQKHILEEPRRLQMGVWQSKSDDAPCGTIGCIAGWTALLGDGFYAGDDSTVRRKAEELLHLFDGHKSFDLFYIDGWPYEYIESYYSAETDKSRAGIVSDRIDYFIKEGK